MIRLALLKEGGAARLQCCISLPSCTGSLEAISQIADGIA